MTWWLWVLLGFALLAGEMLTPGGFFFAFFGIGAIVVGVLTWLGLEPAWLQWLLFTVGSIGAMVPLRGRLVRRLAGGEAPQVDSLVGEGAVLLDDLGPGAVAKVELRGSAWTARSAGERAMTKGERVRVTRVDGLTVWVRPE